MFTVKNIALLFAVMPLALALPATEAENSTDVEIQAGYWAQFCNDADCSEGCGQSVKVSNSGCLNQSGRKSIRFHGTPGNDYALVVSPGGDCPCQSTCASVPSGTECWSIEDYSSALSFRFISGNCDSNNC